MFWNPQDEQIPKLSLEFQFDQDLIEKIRKHLVDFLMISTVVVEKFKQKQISLQYHCVTSTAAGDKVILEINLLINLILVNLKFLLN